MKACRAVLRGIRGWGRKSTLLCGPPHGGPRGARSARGSAVGAGKMQEKLKQTQSVPARGFSPAGEMDLLKATLLKANALIVYNKGLCPSQRSQLRATDP